MELTDRQVLKLVETYLVINEHNTPLYRWIHSHISNCGHEDWRQEAVDAYNEFVEMGEIRS